MTGPRSGDLVFLVDTDNVVHRVYHSHSADKFRAPDGTPMNAVVGWVRSIRRLRQYTGRVESRWIIPCFDSRPSWRVDLWPRYKAGRADRDDDLDRQLPLVREVCEPLGMAAQIQARLEADDLIAGFTEALAARGCRVIIVSNDKDLLQLVRPGVVQMRREKGEIVLLGPDHVRDRFGVGPSLLGDLLALAGDSADGIPGLAGVGPRRAAKILGERGSLDAAIRDWMLTSSPLGERLRDNADDLRLYRRLVGLGGPEVDLDAMRPGEPSSRALTAFFARFGYPRWESAVDPVGE